MMLVSSGFMLPATTIQDCSDSCIAVWLLTLNSNARNLLHLMILFTYIIAILDLVCVPALDGGPRGLLIVGNIQKCYVKRRSL